MRFAFCLLVLTSCAHIDRTVALPSGATLLVAKGWTHATRAGALMLEDPAHTVKIFVLESREPDAEKAVADSWRRVDPTFALHGAAEQVPPTGGWESHTELAYRANDARLIQADARRFAGITYVVLVDGAQAANSREAQIGAALESLHPSGMHEESLAGRTPSTIAPALLDAFIDQAHNRLHVPGGAVAVVAHGQVVYQRTFGVRTLGQPDPVTAQTLFEIGSVTKPMTTMMQAALVDAGTLKWTTPVTTLLPGFALGDADVTRRLQLWHMSCACTGMPRQDLENIFEFEGVTPEQRLASMKTMKPTTGFGETFQYSNLLVAAGGFAAAHAFAPKRPLADAYAAAMQEKIFDPIGMTATTLDFAVVARSDHAQPHALDIDGIARPIPLAYERDVLPIAPAGAVWSNLTDMERYVTVELSGGIAPGGRRVVSAANLAERRRVRIQSGTTDGYGLGLGVARYRDLKTFGHDGGSFGFGTTMLMLPDPQIAIIVLTNIRNGDDYEQLPFNSVVQRRVIEALFDARPEAQISLDYLVARKHPPAHIDRRLDPAWLAPLVGSYTNPDLGRVTLSADGIFDVGEWKSACGREPNGTDKLILLDPPFAGGEVIVGTDRSHTPTLSSVYGPKTYVFRRTSP